MGDMEPVHFTACGESWVEGGGGWRYNSHLAHFSTHHFYPWHLYVGPPPPHENPGSAPESCNNSFTNHIFMGYSIIKRNLQFKPWMVST